MWSALLGESWTDDAIHSLLLTRNNDVASATVASTLSSATVLSLCIEVVVKRDVDVMWIRHKEWRNRPAPMRVYDSDVAAFRRQAELVSGAGRQMNKKEMDEALALHRIHIKYLDDYADVKRYLVNAHLSPTRPNALVLDNVEVFCGRDTERTLELAALTAELVSSSTSSLVAMSMALDTRHPYASTARLAHLFERRFDQTNAEDGASIRLMSLPHSNSLGDDSTTSKTPAVLIRSLADGQNVRTDQGVLVWIVE